MDDLFGALLKAFDEAGLWRDGVELIGSWSFLMYQRHLGVRRLPLRTQDIDFLVPRPYPNREKFALAQQLAKIGFRSATAADGSTYFLHPELKIEFLVPERGKGDSGSWNVKSLGIRAIPLRFMDMLAEESIILKEGDAKVRVPKPINFCLHKLLIAQRRRNLPKREKDIEQAVCVLEIVEPAAFQRALTGCPRKWRLLIEKSLQDAWNSLPLERPILKRHGVTPQS